MSQRAMPMPEFRRAQYGLTHIIARTVYILYEW